MGNKEPEDFSSMIKSSKIGEGSYGVVYSGKFKENKYPDPNRLFAIKRNFKEISAAWIGNIRELDILNRLKGHPCIVNLHTVAIEDPFDKSNPMTPSTADKKIMKEDKIHFVLDYAEMCGDKYLQSQDYSYSTSKIILTQILLGLEYIHSKSIIHRDLKPSNILITFKDGMPDAKICDFGMSGNYNKNEESVKGVVTCWYRAPEICMGHRDYDFKSDVWSFGCLLYEFIHKQPWLGSVKDDDKKIIEAIFKNHEVEVCDEDYAYLNGKATQNRNPNKRGMATRKSFKSQMKMHVGDEKEFEKHCGSVELYFDLLRKCLEFNPQKRPTITEVLNHEFFKNMFSYIENVRQHVRHLNQPHTKIMINNSMERYWAMNYFSEFYNNRESCGWYNHGIMFHALDLMDRYLMWIFNGSQNSVPKFSPKESELNEGAVFYTKTQIEEKVWICLYMMHKYYSTMNHPLSIRRFFPKHINIEEDSESAYKFEERMIKYATNFTIFFDTLYECIDKYNDKNCEELIAKLLGGYISTTNYIGSVEHLYTQITNKK
jgi:serine/threonine protein kinase